MRILQIAPFFPPAYGFGGLLEAAHQITKALAKRGHEIVVYTSDAKDWQSRMNVRSVEYLDNMEVHYFKHIPIKFIKNLFVTPGLIPEARREVKNFDVVHLHGHWTFQNAILHHYAKKYSVPYIIQAHGSLPKGETSRGLKNVYDYLFGSKVLRDSSKAIAVSSMEVEQYLDEHVPPHKIVRIPNGIDVSQLTAKKGEFRKKYSIGSDKRVILFLGRLHSIKGVDLLIEAYAHLLNEFDDLLLVIVGPDDGQLPQLKKQVQSLGLTDDILFTGLLYENEKLEAYADSDLFVLPSRYEIFGIVILEAYAFSLPVVASNLSSLSEFVQHDNSGYLFKTGDVQSLVDQMTKILRDQEKANQMGVEGRKILEGRYSIDKIAESIETLYEVLIK